MNNSRQSIWLFLVAFSVVLTSCDIRKVESIGEKIYYQDDDCLIMGRGTRSYDWGPAENTYSFFLLCSESDSNEYGSNKFLVTSQADLIRIFNTEAKKVSIEYCPMFNQINAKELRDNLRMILERYPIEIRFSFSITENTEICESVYGPSWRNIDSSKSR